ncbi:MAG: HAD hydrolase family protein [Endomicrobium sp.]|jgi:3-deoxy-D-manno-octulosonate 8-phosphate phosphatase (KDO 8-P phosphatase)|nr:HAD hydrolase family protein [Endomicrobium sp.]
MQNINIIKKAKNIKFFACDVDGVLTRGEIIIFNDNEDVKIWNVKDGMGFNLLSEVSPKIKTAWITGGCSLQVEKRANDMKINYLFQNCMNKKEALNKILGKESLSVYEVAYIGDDILDIPVLKIVGFSTCPSNACDDVKMSADYISSFKGGEGVVREVIEIIIKAKCEWQKILNRYID